MANEVFRYSVYGKNLGSAVDAMYHEDIVESKSGTVLFQCENGNAVHIMPITDDMVELTASNEADAESIARRLARNILKGVVTCDFSKDDETNFVSIDANGNYSPVDWRGHTDDYCWYRVKGLNLGLTFLNDHWEEMKPTSLKSGGNDLYTVCSTGKPVDVSCVDKDTLSIRGTVDALEQFSLDLAKGYAERLDVPVITRMDVYSANKEKPRSVSLDAEGNVSRVNWLGHEVGQRRALPFDGVFDLVDTDGLDKQCNTEFSQF